ncbi:MAG: hypothetical protein EWV83_09045 [Microcystis sp. M_OC_Ca_00000000_S217Cul]|nr:MAG: hypothetical protein EWV83_09045 [Microcystis sp. M_OC_Ca_00000000_S217Cul]
MWEAQIRGLVSFRELFGVSTEIEQSSFLNFIFLRLCGNEVYTDGLFNQIVLKVFPSKHFTIS